MRTDVELIHGSDTTIAVYDLGGDGVPVLFVHATGFCAEVWRPVVQRMDGIHAMALDVRCHGRSGRVPHDLLQWTEVAHDVTAAARHFGLSGAVGVGHSMGGALLLLAEAARPGTFRGLWGYEPIVFPPEVFEGDGTDDNPLSAGAARRRASFPSRDAARENFASKPPMQAFAADALDGYLDGGFEELEDGSVTLRCRPEDEAHFYRMGGSHRAWDRLPDLELPVWVARGAETEPGPASVAPMLADRLPAGRLVEHPELGHFGPMEAPEVVAAELTAAIAAFG